MARETVEVVFILTHDIGPWELSRWSDILEEWHFWKASAHVPVFGGISCVRLVSRPALMILSQAGCNEECREPLPEVSIIRVPPPDI